ncbi:hypothetical protein SAMN02745116_01719 [Pilibacter termitis]|uniref:Polymerase beta nucleotidyltransferase domain-containing protein n=1 Tax=Pilibacter termitis TaxID=263852 RepID=A0A1T4PAA4_9ENTE|nr:nucleotidyltransferase domain-containing protein [Pilibacter termitis]SJZ88321.1 hypothetical protein SAMN02745116_01719 [Pilibacter termitis]
MVYTIEEIKEKVKPIAEKYEIQELYLFGSYARGQADEKSDLDFVYKPKKSVLEFYRMFDSFSNELSSAFGLLVDVISLDSVEKAKLPIMIEIKNNFEKEKVALI